jgi:anthranilate phosphoribosyltransferase
MRLHMTPIRTKHTAFIDTCGTGGDGSGTFNISTAAAIVTAAAGVPVAKHGNRSMTSKTGSADVLAELGVNIEASVATVERCLDEVGICFCFAPQLHASMRHVSAARKKLGVPTIFNMLGPLCNPASAPFQLLGVGKPQLRELLAQALSLLGAKRAVVVCGEDGLDEVTLGGATNVTEVTGDSLVETTWRPADFGLAEASQESMQVDGPQASAAMIREILSGRTGAARDIVVINAAAALWTAGIDTSLAACAAKTADAIDSGAAASLLAKLAQASHA